MTCNCRYVVDIQVKDTLASNSLVNDGQWTTDGVFFDERISENTSSGFKVSLVALLSCSKLKVALLKELALNNTTLTYLTLSRSPQFTCVS